jgi:hypothetical protein
MVSAVTALAFLQRYSGAVRHNLHRYYGAGDLHFITCSCYRRQPLLGSPRRRDLFLRVLEQVRKRYAFVVVRRVGRIYPEICPGTLRPNNWGCAPSRGFREGASRAEQRRRSHPSHGWGCPSACPNAVKGSRNFRDWVAGPMASDRLARGPV